MPVHHPQQDPSSRRGAILLAVLICMLLSTALAGSLVKATLDEHKLLKSQHRQAQARWLVESGIERAAAALRADAGYTGEIWRIDPAQLGGSHAARVEIRVEQLPNSPLARRIAVTADYPSPGILRARRAKAVDFQLTTGGVP